MIAALITPAANSDLPALLEILDRAAQHLRARGIRQWESPPPPELVSRLIALQQDGHLFRVQAGDPPLLAGLFAFECNRPPFWVDDRSAGYVSTLAIDPQWSGQGLGRTILEWIARHAQHLGCERLRLDCWAPNQRLRAYYAAAGFRHCGNVTPDGYPLALYERLLPAP